MKFEYNNRRDRHRKSNIPLPIALGILAVLLIINPICKQNEKEQQKSAIHLEAYEMYIEPITVELKGFISTMDKQFNSFSEVTTSTFKKNNPDISGEDIDRIVDNLNEDRSLIARDTRDFIATMAESALPAKRVDMLMLMLDYQGDRNTLMSRWETKLQNAREGLKALVKEPE